MISEALEYLEQQIEAMRKEGLVFLLKRSINPTDEEPLAQLAAVLHNRGISPIIVRAQYSETRSLTQTCSVLYVSQHQQSVATDIMTSLLYGRFTLPKSSNLVHSSV